MGILKKDFKFKIVRNLLSKEQIDLITRYVLLKHKWNYDETMFDTKQNNNGDTYFYADPMTESLMMELLPKMEKETGLKLFPTYSFGRVYTFNADLKKHRDRPSCEVSVTIQINSCGTSWPIFMDGYKCEMNNGDGVIYLGCELEHWREPFTGDWQAQTFLHYVDQNGPYAEFKYDKRPREDSCEL